MTTRVDLVWMGDDSPPPDWPLGALHPVTDTPKDLDAWFCAYLPGAEADACLFWHSHLPAPDPDTILTALTRPGHVWHAGLTLGTCGQPGLLDFVAPDWMLSVDPSPHIEATSWRLSFRACLVPLPVLRQMGFIDPGFSTLDAAALEIGHRYIMQGVFTRHLPMLVPEHAAHKTMSLPLEDEIRFMRSRRGLRWTQWALARAVLTGYTSLFAAKQAWWQAQNRAAEPCPLEGEVANLRFAKGGEKPGNIEFVSNHTPPKPEPVTLPENPAVSVIIPTIDRYPYLRVLLAQFAAQTIPPAEIIIIDQTPAPRRDNSLAADFPNLPLHLLVQDQPGQCASRNAGLALSQGDFILFVDDDDEIPPDLIEGHLHNLAAHRADVSCGAVDEVGAGPPSGEFTYLRVSDIFPTNNSMVRREALMASGLFDLAFDRRKRADRDLGMRLYLSGQLMVYNPGVRVLHHHAPQGGLRTHKVRVVTYASSRQNITIRHLPSVSEIYFALRYHSPRQLREFLWIRAFGTLSIRGGRGRKALKVIVGLLMLPDTIIRIQRRKKAARALLASYPQIPTLPGKGG